MRDLIDTFEIGTAALGVLLLFLYGLEVVPDERLLMLALAILALAVGLDNYNPSRPRTNNDYK